jgi:hypothetical protein
MGVLVMDDSEKFFKELSDELGRESWDAPEDENPPMEAAEAFRVLARTCGVIKTQAIGAGFSNDEAFGMAMTYYSMFLSANFSAAQEATQARRDGEEED